MQDILNETIHKIYHITQVSQRHVQYSLQIFFMYYSKNFKRRRHLLLAISKGKLLILILASLASRKFQLVIKGVPLTQPPLHRSNYNCLRQYVHTTLKYQNPREASSRSRIFLNSLVYVCVCMYLLIYVCHVSWPNEKRYRPEIWYTYSHRPYLKIFFCFFEKMTIEGRQPRETTVSLEFFAYILDGHVF